MAKFQWPTGKKFIVLILILGFALILGLFGLAIFLIQPLPSLEDNPETITSVAKTNDAVGTKFSQTSTQLALTPNSSRDITLQFAVSATSPSKVELVPIPSPNFAPTVSPN